MSTEHPLASLIWQIADLLRGPYRPNQYERVMLPMVVLRRFDCVLEPTKEKVLAEYARRQASQSGDALNGALNRVAGGNEEITFHNHSAFDFHKLKGDPANIASNLRDYIRGFSHNVREIPERFEVFASASEAGRMLDWEDAAADRLALAMAE